MITTAWKHNEKITVLLRSELLDKAQIAACGGISDTVREGLELLVANDTYDRLLKMRGKVKFSIPISKLRQDRH
jgi:hypothetical protein